MYGPQFPTPPPGYMPQDFHHRTSPPMSPGAGAPASANYYSPRYGMPSTPRASPAAKGHSRRASTAVPQQQYSNASARGPMHGAFPTPRATPEYVSGFDYDYVYARPPRRARRDSDAPLKHSAREKKRRPSQSAHYVHRVFYDHGYGVDYEAEEDVYRHPPPPYTQYARYESYGDADRFYYDQVPIFEDKTSRPRRASHSTRPAPAQEKTPKRAPPAKTASKATEDDARRAGIPAGYSYKNWDPTEEPIMLLGSVFDANSLGKWIYDWTVFYNGPATPLAEMAGELWLLLIQLAGKVKRAEENMGKIRRKESAEMVEDFLMSGERLWIRFAKLLKTCEDFMWKAAKKENRGEKPVSMGKNSGREFVESIFGRDRELEKTEKLMTGMRLWSMRFDANCEEILRHPSA
ncbi:hypothetical protein C7974DRAFT_403016 [Boeremia exigua]|uniref:uncharacterized protein n=1 Tax=Boeremia exigua TaxID=749465 RepID=UPI001E8D6E86|nr:uncharacterized protein C7974DRAFT_403016 [Boeremia exigua]KAH6614974.1 hypothetical protein C7974DRAFT_403016 [Boeremia exigua]